MRRTPALIVTMSLAAMVGCRPGAAPPRIPAPQAAAPPLPAPAPVNAPVPPPPVQKVRFVFANIHLYPGPVVSLKVDGLPPDPAYGGLYRFVDIANVKGTPPPASPYHLIWGGVNLKDGSTYGGGGDPIGGPFLDTQLGAGQRLTDVTPIGTFQAKSSGFLGKGVGDATALSPLDYTLFEGAVQR